MSINSNRFEKRAVLVKLMHHTDWVRQNKDTRDKFFRGLKKIVNQLDSFAGVYLFSFLVK